MGKQAVLFLCTANSARSVMAEAFLQRVAGDRLEVHSAGLDPKPIHPLTVQVMREVGFELDGRTPHSVSEYLGRKTLHYVVSVCQAAEIACPTVWPFTLCHLAWPFDDPAAGEGNEIDRLTRFRTVRDQIAAKVNEWVKTLPEDAE